MVVVGVGFVFYCLEFGYAVGFLGWWAWVLFSVVW